MQVGRGAKQRAGGRGNLEEGGDQRALLPLLMLLGRRSESDYSGTEAEPRPSKEQLEPPRSGCAAPSTRSTFKSLTRTQPDYR